MKKIHRIKQALKTAGAYAFFYSGITRMYANWRLQGLATVLMYHRITDEHDSVLDYAPGGMDTTLRSFKNQMRFLKKHFHVVTFAELCHILQEKRPIPKKTCVITFDDGWRDNYTNALPVLQELGLPATVFIAVNYVDGGEWYWLERFRFLLARLLQAFADPNLPAEDAKTIRAKLSEYGVEPNEGSKDEEAAFWILALGRQIGAWEPARRKALIETLEGLCAFPSVGAERPFLNWEEVERLAAAGIEIGSHTLTHRELNTLECQDLLTELLESKRRIEAKVGIPVKTFAYPYGKHSEKSRRTASEVGYHGACSTRMGLVSNASNPYAVERIGVHHEVARNIPMFACRLMRFMGRY